MRTAVFDLDGTLIDSMYHWRKAQAEYLRVHGVEVSADMERALYLGDIRLTREYLISLIQPETDLEKTLLFTREIVAGNYERDIHLKPGAAEYLALLRQNGIKCILATATWRYMSEPMLRRMGIYEYFVHDGELCAVCADEMGMGKGSADYFPALMERYSIKPCETTMFEDALYAMRTAKAAGLNVWAIEEIASTATRADIKATADRYFYSWSELCDGDILP